jgi:chromate reductase, NAD(P)H dehydrogenase (quinone)
VARLISASVDEPGMTLTVLGLSGSLREKSHNTALLREARRLAPSGMTIDIALIRDIPLYDADVEARGFPYAVMGLREQVRRADALLIATPEYNFSIPGVLKNTIDWLSRPPFDAELKGKPVAIVGAGGRLGSARAQYHLRQVCGCLSMLPVPRPEVFVLNAWEKFDGEGRLTDAAVAEQLSELLVALADWTLLLRKARSHTSA